MSKSKDSVQYTKVRHLNMCVSFKYLSGLVKNGTKILCLTIVLYIKW